MAGHLRMKPNRGERSKIHSPRQAKPADRSFFSMRSRHGGVSRPLPLRGGGWERCLRMCERDGADWLLRSGRWTLNKALMAPSDFIHGSYCIFSCVFRMAQSSCHAYAAFHRHSSCSATLRLVLPPGQIPGDLREERAVRRSNERGHHVRTDQGLRASSSPFLPWNQRGLRRGISRARRRPDRSRAQHARVRSSSRQQPSGSRRRLPRLIAARAMRPPRAALVSPALQCAAERFCLRRRFRVR